MNYVAGKILMTTLDGNVIGLDANTGEINWQYHLGPGHLLASPATDDERVYIGNMSGRVVALPAKLEAVNATQPAAQAR